MGAQIYRNLRAVFPIGVIIGLWFAFADSFQVFAASVKLLENIRTVTIVLIYGFLVTSIVIFPLLTVVSIAVTLADARRRGEPARHTGKVIGIALFCLILIFGYLAIKPLTTGTSPLDPRIGFPILAIPFIGWLLCRIIGLHIGQTYNPSKWPRLAGNHLSAVAGASVFVFGSFMTQYHSREEEIYTVRAFFATAENIIYYIVFLTAGLLVWLLMRLVCNRMAHRGGWGVTALIAAFIAVPLIAFLRPTPPDNPDMHNPNPGNKGRNVILISVDTLRYDKLGCNGNGQIQTPDIDALAANSLNFDNCIVPIPLTLPSHTTMLTGLNPRTHGLRVQDYHLDESITTIAERLSDEGFTCGGFVSMSILRGRNCLLNQGFHYYDDYWAYRGESRLFPAEIKYFFGAKILNKLLIGRTINISPAERLAEPAVDSALKWLDYVKDEDFFCFLHLFDPHWDYNAPEPYKKMYDPEYDESRLNYNPQLKFRIWENQVRLSHRDIDHIAARYDGEITYIDAQLGRFLNRLKELGLWDKSMIILTSDHGESFEHDYYFGHADRVYQSCIQVPLIIKPFGRARGERYRFLCTNADFFPTICEALGLKMKGDVEGISLARLFGNRDAGDFKPYPVVYSESYGFSNYDVQHYGKTYAIIRDNEKLIYSPYAFPYAPIYQYYDLSVDPLEGNNLYDSRTEAADSLFKLLEKWVDADEEPAHGLTGRIELENLRTLQYLR